MILKNVVTKTDTRRITCNWLYTLNSIIEIDVRAFLGHRTDHTSISMNSIHKNHNYPSDKGAYSLMTKRQIPTKEALLMKDLVYLVFVTTFNG